MLQHDKQWMFCVKVYASMKDESILGFGSLSLFLDYLNPSTVWWGICSVFKVSNTNILWNYIKRLGGGYLPADSTLSFQHRCLVVPQPPFVYARGIHIHIPTKKWARESTGFCLVDVARDNVMILCIWEKGYLAIYGDFNRKICN